jgi:drug/metabolite transporter (DMT)-like permease
MSLPWIAWVIVCVVWGTTYLAIRVALETVPVVLVAGIRWMSAGVILAAVVYATGGRLPGRHAWASLALLGFLMNVIGNGLVVWAEQYVASGLTAVVVAMVPFWQVAIEALIPGGERITRRTIVGLLLGFSGILVLVWPELAVGGTGMSGMIAGIVALQIACAGWAMGTSYTKRDASAAEPLSASALQMLLSGVMLLGLSTALGEWSELHFTMRTAAAMIYLTVMGSAVAYTAYVYIVRRLPISTVSLYAYINPIIAVVLGTLLLAEPFSLRIVLASALVLAGVAVVRGVQSSRVSSTPTRRSAA